MTHGGCEWLTSVSRSWCSPALAGHVPSSAGSLLHCCLHPILRRNKRERLLESSWIHPDISDWTRFILTFHFSFSKEPQTEHLQWTAGWFYMATLTKHSETQQITSLCHVVEFSSVFFQFHSFTLEQRLNSRHEDWCGRQLLVYNCIRVKLQHRLIEMFYNLHQLYVTMLQKVRTFSLNPPKNNGVCCGLRPIPHPSLVEICSSFCVILLTNQQTHTVHPWPLSILN